MLTRKITYLQKKRWKSFHNFFPPKLLHPKFELNLVLGYTNQANSLHNSFLNAIHMLSLIPIMETFNNLIDKKIVKVFPCFLFMCVTFLVNIALVVSFFMLD